MYNYPGYQPFDIPKAQYNGSFEVTSSLLQILTQCNLFEVLDDENCNLYFKNMINIKIFYFLVEVSFQDFFLCKCLLFPYMFSLLKRNKAHYQTFLEQILKTVNLCGVKDYIYFEDIFDKLTSLIEEYAIMGPKFYKQYEIYATLFLEMINDDKFFKLWERGKNFFGNLRNIFLSNNFHLRTVFDKIKEFYGDEQKNQEIGQIFLKIINEGNLESKQMHEYEDIYLKYNKKYLTRILNYYDKKTTLCQGTFIFYDLMRACYPINTIKDYVYNLNNYISPENKKML